MQADLQDSPNSIRSFGKWQDLLIVVVALFLIPALASFLTGAVYPALEGLDPANTFLSISVHHVLQLLLTIGAMLLLYSKSLSRWGFNLHNLRTSLRWIAAFVVIYGAIEFMRISNLDEITFAYPLTQRNMLGIQGFQYLLSGLGEEPLFRAFVMVFLAAGWKQIFKIGRVEIPVTVIFATLLFMVAHIHIDLFSFSISGFDFDQQMKALQLGIVYGLAFHYTQSLLAPIVMHGFSNGFQFTLMYYFSG